jgi:hypothetical protein
MPQLRPACPRLLPAMPGAAVWATLHAGDICQRRDVIGRIREGIAATVQVKGI